MLFIQALLKVKRYCIGISAETVFYYCLQFLNTLQIIIIDIIINMINISVPYFLTRKSAYAVFASLNLAIYWNVSSRNNRNCIYVYDPSSYQVSIAQLQ
jgi:hypothetical protein